MPRVLFVEDFVGAVPEAIDIVCIEYLKTENACGCEIGRSEAMNYFEGAYRLSIALWIAGTLGMAGYGFWQWWSNPFRQFDNRFEIAPVYLEMTLPWLAASVVGPIAAIAARHLVRWVRAGFRSN